MERIFLTGSTGFVGSELAAALSDSYEVYALVRTTSNKHSLDPLKGCIDRIQIRYGNLTDYTAVKKIIADIEPHAIIHVGAATAVRHSFDSPMEFQKTNHLATVNLVHAAMSLPDFKKFLFASTMEVYGWQKPGTPFTEDFALHPESPYAVSKYAAEEYVRMAGKAYGLPYIVSRACNTYGRKYSTGFIVEYLIAAMLKNETVYLGTPDAVRDMMYIDDHVNAYVTSLTSDVTNDVFNFSTGNMTAMSTLAEKIKELTGYKGTMVNGFPPGYPSRPVVSPFLSLNSAKAKERLGWEPRTSLEKGLEQTIERVRQQLS